MCVWAEKNDDDEKKMDEGDEDDKKHKQSWYKMLGKDKLAKVLVWVCLPVCLPVCVDAWVCSIL